MVILAFAIEGIIEQVLLNFCQATDECPRSLTLRVTSEQVNYYLGFNFRED
jgi:hypothetical protein